MAGATKGRQGGETSPAASARREPEWWRDKGWAGAKPLELKRGGPVATVQNRYNVDDRKWNNTLKYCEEHRLGFMPWAPVVGIAA